MPEFVVGQTVIRRSRNNEDSLAVIERITPSGQIVAGGTRYTKHGVEVGSHDRWFTPWILAASPNEIAAVKRVDELRRSRRVFLHAVDASKGWTAAQLTRATAALREIGETP
jgi:hypothetical protein